MPNIDIRFNPDASLKVEEADSVVQTEIEEFSKYMREFAPQSSYAGALAPWEKTLLRSYLVYKLRGHVTRSTDGQG